MANETDDRVAAIGMQLATKKIEDGMTGALRATEVSGAAAHFNRELVRSGLLPDAIADITYVTTAIGMWIGRHLRDKIPLDLAIADIDVIASTPLETLLEEAPDRASAVEARMMKAALEALATCCEPGRVVEAATFVIRTSVAALTSALEQQPSA